MVTTSHSVHVRKLACGAVKFHPRLRARGEHGTLGGFRPRSLRSLPLLVAHDCHRACNPVRAIAHCLEVVAAIVTSVGGRFSGSHRARVDSAMGAGVLASKCRWTNLRARSPRAGSDQKYPCTLPTRRAFASFVPGFESRVATATL
jgi:hypothetical protein